VLTGVVVWLSRENVLPPDAAPVGTFMPSPVKVLVGGAVRFVMDVQRFERF